MMAKKHKEPEIVKTPQDLLSHEGVAKYKRKQNLLVRLVKTKVGKALLGKRLFNHEDILKQQDELLNNLFGDKLDKVDSHYIDAMFLLYSKRKNKSKKPDNLCIRGFYDSAEKKLQKNNFDISTMEVRIDNDPKATEEEQLFMSLPEYLNLLENIRLEVKKRNGKYEKIARDELKDSNVDQPSTDYELQDFEDNVRKKKTELCGKAYEDLSNKSYTDVDFSTLCHIFYTAFKGAKSLRSIEEKLEKLSGKDIVIDEIFLRENFDTETHHQKIVLENLLIILEKLLTDSSIRVHLRDMYDIN